MAEQDETSGEEKRRRILDAAFAVCQERGVHAARMEEVAARAQVSKGTLYRYFESKEDLFLATIIDSYAKARDASVPAGRSAERAALDPAEALRDRLDGLARALSVATPRVRVHHQAWGVVADSPDAAKRLDEFLTGFHRERLREYEDFVRQGQAQGLFRSDVDAATLAQMISGLTVGFIYRAAFDPASASPEALRGCFEILLRDLLGYAPPARPTEVDAGG